jgi:hypothetical protein
VYVRRFLERSLFVAKRIPALGIEVRAWRWWAWILRLLVLAAVRIDWLMLLLPPLLLPSCFSCSGVILISEGSKLLLDGSELHIPCPSLRDPDLAGAAETAWRGHAALHHPIL